MAALTKHAADVGVCKLASYALWIIASGDDDACKDRCAAAIPNLIAALTNHAADADVYKYASAALGNIASGDDNTRKDSCAVKGAIPALVTALHTHMGSASVCFAAVTALSRIAECASLTNPAHGTFPSKQHTQRKNAIFLEICPTGALASDRLVTVSIAHASDAPLQNAALKLFAALRGIMVPTARDLIEAEKKRRADVLAAAAANALD